MNSASHAAKLARRSTFAATFAPLLVEAQGFDKVNQTVINVNAILTLIAVGVATIAIVWVGFKMMFQGARLSDVANVLIGATLIGGAAAFAGFLVN